MSFVFWWVGGRGGAGGRGPAPRAPRGRSSKDRRDIYYRRAKEEGWRARSAYKLLQIDEQYGLLKDGVTRVVDLCAAPGSWSQVLAKRLCGLEPRRRDGKAPGVDGDGDRDLDRDRDLDGDRDGDGDGAKDGDRDGDGARAEAAEVGVLGRSSGLDEKGKAQVGVDVGGKAREGDGKGMSGGEDTPVIVAVDLQPMAPIPGVTQLQGDITSEKTMEAIFRCFEGRKAHLVVSDGAPDVTGMHDLDEYIQAQLLLSALQVAAFLLEPGGAFVSKIFRGRDVTLIYAQLKLFFDDVTVAKPRSSRNSSIESFVVCRGFNNPQDEFQSDFMRSLRRGSYTSLNEPFFGPGRTIVPFVACGDLNGLDSDRSYPLEDPTQVVYRNGTSTIAQFKEMLAKGSGRLRGLDPIAPPTAPPYKTAMAILKKQRLG